jgi:protein transport protein HofC/type IV pilus assembly protein PilC
MPWYKIKHQNGKIDYRYELSERKVIVDAINRGYWQISISEWKPKKLDYRSLQTFYKEIQSALQSGLQLNQALSHFALSSSHPTIATTSKAILSELENGTAFNEALSKLTNATAKPYCQLLNSQGSREDCEKSLSISIIQLRSLLDWSQRLLKAIIYPFSVIQIALIILIVNRVMQQKAEESYFFDLINDLCVYLACCIIQLIIVRSLHQGQACYWLEKYSENFRLTKLFALLSTTRKTGVTLQHALRSMPDYFQHTLIKEEIYQVYYTLRLGKNYAASFPARWFPHESAIALHSAEQDGDIERALILAAKEHEKRWQKSITLLEKLIPAACLLVAGGFVASALIALYAPLIEMS